MTTRDDPQRVEFAALLLSGGASTRMGRDKTQLVVQGMTLARRTGQLVERVVDTALEVGPGSSGLAVVREEPAGTGPLAAIDAGRHALRERGHRGGALVIACDLPLLTEELLRFLLHYDSPASVVPVVQGHAQPLLARWSTRDLDAVADLVLAGERSLRHLVTSADVVLLEESQWSAYASRETFDDVDTLDDARRLCIRV